MPNWLSELDVPLFVSHRRLARYRSDYLPRARTVWALDSGGFTELSLHGEWTSTPRDYARAVRRYSEEIGQMVWAAPQDWMCEPWILDKTGLTVEEHQRMTVENLIELRDIAPDLPIVPVLQGWAIDDYLRCIDLYAQHGIDLETEPLVGVGSVCRRQGTTEITVTLQALQHLSLHGFGVKAKGLTAAWPYLTSADSMAWSYRARHDRPLPGCTHKSCANCPRYAVAWRERVLKATLERPFQPGLWDEERAG